MVLQSIFIYSFLIISMVFFGYIYALKQSYNITNKNLNSDPSSGVVYLFFIIFIFSILMGLRYDVGADYINYKMGYVFNLDVGKREIIFLWVKNFFKSFNFHYTIYFGFLAFLNISFYIFAFKRNSFIIPLLLFFLITNGDWLFWMNGIRQSIAMCIWIYALNFIEKKNFLHYLFLCIIAMGFHKSAIILITFYPILKNGKDYFNNINLQYIFIVGAFLFQYTFNSIFVRLETLLEFIQISLLGGIYDYTPEKILGILSTSDGSGLAYIFKLFLSIIIIKNSLKLKLFFNSKWFKTVYFFFIIGTITQNMFPSELVVLTRPFRYFFIFRSIVFAYFVYYLLKIKRPNHFIFGVTLIIVFISLFFLSILYANKYSHLWYQFYK